MLAVTGDETGLVKLVNLKRKTVVSRCGVQSRKHGVTQLSWIPGSTSHVASLCRSGVIKVWDTLTETQVETCSGAGDDGVLLQALPTSFLTCSRSGTVRVLSRGISDDADSAVIREISVGKTVHAARYHATTGTVAVGGPEHDLALWDIETGAMTFQARNVPNTILDLRVPVWVSALQFLPVPGAQQASELTSTSAARTDASPNLLALVSRHRHVRLYDIRASPRPTTSVEVGEYAFTALDVAADGLSLLTGDSIGTMLRLDLRTGLKELGTYKGVGGAVRSIAVSATQPYFASASLDRHLHVHNVSSRARLRRLYLKQCLTSVLLVPTTGTDGRGSEEAELAPEPPPDTRVRITYSRGAALRPTAAAAVAAGDEDDGDAVWEELDMRSRAAAGADGAAEVPRLAGSKHSREAVPVSNVLSTAETEGDDQDGLESDEDGMSDDDLDDGDAMDDEDDDEVEVDGDESDPDSGDDEDDDEDLDDGLEEKDSRPTPARRSEGFGAGLDDDDDDPLVSSVAAAKSLRREVEAAKRSEDRLGGRQATGGRGRTSDAAIPGKAARGRGPKAGR